MQVTQDLSGLLAKFESEFEEEQHYKSRFLSLLEEDECFLRSNLLHHFTGSCWVTNASLTKVLLLHHAKLEKWLQPGGHADGEEDLLSVARKELSEETGIMETLNQPTTLFDIDIHTIPLRKNVPEHEHFDARFHFIVKEDLNLEINEESNAFQWVDLDRVPELVANERSIVRMVHKTKLLSL